MNGTPMTGHYFFNPSGLSLPACFFSSQAPGTPGGCPAATYGTLGRNAFRGPDLVNFDLALEKRTNLTETVQLNFRAEFFNVLNHTEWQPPTSTHAHQFDVAGTNHVDVQSAHRPACAAASILTAFLLFEDDLSAHHGHADARFSDSAGCGGKDIARENGQVREFAWLQGPRHFSAKFA